MKQSTLTDTPLKTNATMRPIRSAVTGEARMALLCLTAAACGFPRPPDVVGDAPGGSDGSVGSIVAIQVSPSGDDADDGLVRPVKTLKRAIGLAAANTQITQIILATGTYSMLNGETFPYTVPPNVTIIGPAGGGAILEGSTMGPGLAVDVGGLQDVDLRDFTIAITVREAATLKNIRVLTSTTAVQAETAARVTVSNLDITGATGTCATGLVLNGNAALAASALSARVLGTTLLANDHSMATLMNVNVAGDSSCPNGVLRIGSDGMFMISDLLIDGGNSGIGVSSPSGGAPSQVVLENVTVRDVDIDALGVGNGTVRMTGGELSHTRQTSFEVVGGNCTLTNVSILSSGVAFYSQDATLTMRGCTISNNTMGGDLGVRAVVDLGTTMNPGGNVFNNISVGLRVEDGNETQLVQVVGNTWKPVQGADSNGKYAQGTVIHGPIACDSNSGNFCIPLSDESLEL